LLRKATDRGSSQLIQLRNPNLNRNPVNHSSIYRSKSPQYSYGHHPHEN